MRFSRLEYNKRANRTGNRTSEASEKGQPMADITEVDYIWKNGELIPWADATTHILSHSLHYGSGVFEGIRCYQNPETKKSYVFRLRDHMERLHRSCKIACIDLPYTADEVVRSHARGHSREQASVVLHPPHRVPRLRRDGRGPHRPLPPTWPSPAGRGTPIWAADALGKRCVRGRGRRGVSAPTTPSRLR